MPYLPTAQEWLSQSALLLEARPRTTRITTKYTLSKPTIKPRKPKPSKPDHPTTSSTTATNTTETETALSSTESAPASTTTTAAASAPAPPLPTTRAILTLKTYDPASGVTLKYKTDKAAEVGRLISCLARLGRTMAGLPTQEEVVDTVMADAPSAIGGVDGTGDNGDGGVDVAAPVLEKEKGGNVGSGGGGGGGGGQQQGGKKGKKKGKR